MNKYDTHNPPEGHFKRFKKRLENDSIKKTTKSKPIKWYLVAASFALIVSLWYNFKPQDNDGYELGDVSTQMKETQNYFAAVIHAEIKKINKQKNKLNTHVVVDALKRVDLLENEYKNLSKELKKTGFDKRIINAMIFNFQQRIVILQDLLDQLNKIKQRQDENKLQV